MKITQRIRPCLWFDSNAEEAAKFYVSIFDDSRIVSITHHGEAGQDTHGRPPGSVMVVAFELAGQGFTALNGGPVFTFSEAVSFEVACESQAEVDRYWEALLEGGTAQQCGWLKDRFGVSWQIVPTVLLDMLQDEDAAKADRVMAAVMQMVKPDIATLQAAYEGL